MARVYTVNKARKAIPSAGIAVGDKYFWWKFRFGPKHVSKTYPKGSQLTQSEFTSAYLTIQEELVVGDDKDATVQAMRDAAEELRSLGQEQEDKLGNMPEGLQQGSTGELLQERADACSSEADELDSAADELEAWQPDEADDEAETDGDTAEADDEGWRDEAERLLGDISWSAP